MRKPAKRVGHHKPEIAVTAVRMEITANEPGEDRPVELVKVDLRLLSPEDRFVFVLEPPEALKLAEKLRAVALKLGRGRSMHPIGNRPVEAGIALLAEANGAGAASASSRRKPAAKPRAKAKAPARAKASASKRQARRQA